MNYSKQDSEKQAEDAKKREKKAKEQEREACREVVEAKADFTRQVITSPVLEAASD